VEEPGLPRLDEAATASLAPSIQPAQIELAADLATAVPATTTAHAGEMVE
jgi:hypothetical protein